MANHLVLLHAEGVHNACELIRTELYGVEALLQPASRIHIQIIRAYLSGIEASTDDLIASVI